MSDTMSESINFIGLWYKDGQFVFGTPGSETIKNALAESEAIDGTAKWVFKKTKKCDNSLVCSGCGNIEYIPQNFCSNCGRKMVGIKREGFE